MVSITKMDSHKDGGPLGTMNTSCSDSLDFHLALTCPGSDHQWTDLSPSVHPWREYILSSWLYMRINSYVILCLRLKWKSDSELCVVVSHFNMTSLGGVSKYF